MCRCFWLKEEGARAASKIFPEGIFPVVKKRTQLLLRCSVCADHPLVCSGFVRNLVLLKEEKLLDLRMVLYFLSCWIDFRLLKLSEVPKFSCN